MSFLPNTSNSSSSSQVAFQESNPSAITKQKTTSTHNSRNYQELTQDVVDELKVLRPQLKNGDLSEPAAAKKLRIPLTRLRHVLACLDNDINPLRENKGKRLTKDQVTLINEFRVKIDKGEMTQAAAIVKVGVSKSAFYSTVQKLKKGEDPSETKNRQRVTKKIKEKIEKLIPELDNNRISTEEAADKCNLSMTQFRVALRKIRKGEDPSQAKAWKRVTQKVVDAIKAKLPKIKDVNKQEFADELKISYPTLNKIIKDLEAGKDPLQKKAQHKLTKKDEEKIKKFIPQLEAGEMTYRAIEKELEKEGEAPSIDSIKKIVANLRKGKSLPEKPPVSEKLKNAIKVFKARLPEINEGTFSVKKAAEEAKISETYARSIVKDLKAGKDPTMSKESSSNKSQQPDEADADDEVSSGEKSEDDDVPLKQLQQKASQQ